MLKIIAIGIAGMMSLSCMIGFYAVQSGIAVVDVRDKVGGKHVFLPIPVGLVNTGLNIMPSNISQQFRGEFGSHHGIIQKLSTELEKLPDTEFVEIQSKGDRILVSKSGRNLIIDVDTPRESIYVRVPIRSTGDLMAKLANSAEVEY